MLSVQNATIGYQDTIVIDNLFFAVKPHETVSIIGPNGCGKSSLFQCLKGKKPFLGGSANWSDGAIPKHSSVEQQYRETLLPWLSVEENICFPLMLERLPKLQQRLRLLELLKELPIELPLSAKANEISGGQAQLAVLLRSLIFRPKVLFLDEPFSALDYLTKLRVRQFLYDKLADYGITTLIISHDPEDCIFLGHRVMAFNGSTTAPLETIPVSLAGSRDFTLTTTTKFIELKNRVVEAAYGGVLGMQGLLPLSKIA